MIGGDRAQRGRGCWLAPMALSTALGLSAMPALAAGQAGVASAVLPAAKGTPAAQAPRVLQVGIDVFQDERIETGSEGKAQMLMLDGSALTVGPNSDLVIDEFVYDPDAKAGKIAMSATKGLFRLVGGRISKKTPMTLKTPTATIGIRGGIAVVTVTPEATTGVFVFGEQMTMSSGGVEKSTRRPGSQMQATDANAPPSDPAPVAGGGLGAALDGLEGRGDSDGGAGAEKPTDNDVASSQVSSLGSAQAPAAVAPPAAQGGDSGPSEPTGGQSEDNAQVSTAQQNQATDDAAGVTDGRRVAGVDTSVTYAGRYISNPPFLNFDFDTARADVNTARTFSFTNGDISSGRFTATLSGGSIDLPATKSGEAFEFADTGTSSPFGAVSGTGFITSDGNFAYYTLKESGASNNPASIFGGLPFTGSLPTSGIESFTLSPGFPGDYAIPFLDADFGGNFGTGSGALKSVSPVYVAHSDNAGVSNFSNDARTVFAYGAVVIEGSGSSQKSAMAGWAGNSFEVSGDEGIAVSGFARSSVRRTASETAIRGSIGGTTVPGDGINNFFGDTSADAFVLDANFFDTGNPVRPTQTAAGFVQTLQNTAVSQKNYFQEQYAVRTSNESGLGTSRTSRTLNGFTGFLVEVRTGFDSNGNGIVDESVFRTKSNDPQNLTIQTDATTNRAQATFLTSGSGSETSTTLTFEFGQLTGVSAARQAFIDDETFVLRESSQRNSLVDATTTTPRSILLSERFISGFSNTLPDGVSMCACNFLNVGFWASDLRLSGQTARYRVHMAPFVAGELPSSGDIPSTGSATFVGNALINVRNGADKYLAASDYTHTWNFATRSGDVTLNNLDGKTYTGSKTGGNVLTNTISITSNDATRSGVIAASFFKNGSDPAGGVAGQIRIFDAGQFGSSSSVYRAGGVVFAEKQ